MSVIVARWEKNALKNVKCCNKVTAFLNKKARANAKEKCHYFGKTSMKILKILKELDSKKNQCHNLKKEKDKNFLKKISDGGN